MRNRERVAARDALDAVFLERLPQVDCRRCFDPADGQRGHVLVAEHHVAVQVGALANARGPLVAHEAREAAVGRPVVGFFGSVPDLLPDPSGCVAAVLAVASAKAKAPTFLLDHSPVPEADESRHGEVAVSNAHRVPVGPGFWIGTEIHLPQELGVIGDHGEVEGAVELYGAQGVALGVIGLDSERFSLCKPVGVARSVPRVLGVGIEGVGGVDVGVSKKRATQGIDAGAGFAARLRRGRAERQESDQANGIVAKMQV